MKAPDWPRSDLLAHRVRATPDATATVDAASDRTRPYRALDAAVDAVADRLANHLEPTSEAGHRPRIGLAATVDEEFAVQLFAAWRLGAVAVPLAPDAPAGQIARRTDRADLDLVVEPAGGAGLLQLPDGDVDSSAVGVDTPPRATVGVPVDGDGSAHEPARWDPDETALILFSSGTTGTPKGVRLTHRNLTASAHASASRLGVDPADRWLASLPTHHMGGLAPIVRSTIYGTTVVFQSATEPGALADTMASRDVTGVSLVPTLLSRLLDDGWEPPASLRFVLLGGAPAGTDLLARALDRGVPVHPTYGATEAASQIATATPAQVREYPGTVGQPLVSTDVGILDDGEPCPPGTAGEVVVAGPTVSPGYLDEDATRVTFREDGFHTGDLGYRDGDGRLWVLGRLDDAIQTGGETVHPERVAGVLRAHAAIAEAAVVGLADDEWGERVVALVVPGDGHEIDHEALRAACRDELAPFEVPKEIRTAASLPRTDSGTVDRSAVRRRFDK